MQRLRRHDERGASAVLVVVVMTVLLGFAALSIDAGALWWDRKQLQNGADAGALAVAQQCAEGSCTGGSGTANSLAVSNKIGGDAAGSVVSLSAATGRVTVKTTSTRAHWFAPFVGVDSTNVAAEATAVWGAPSKAKVVPFAASSCWFAYQTGSMVGVPPPIGTSFSIPLKSKSNSSPDGALTCGTRAAHGDTAGGFGWVQPDGSLCSKVIDLNNPWIGVSTGQPAPCDLSTAMRIGDEMFMPLYDAWRGSGSGAQYHIYAFAAFRLTGYCFGPGQSLNVGWPGCKDLVENNVDRGPNLRGTFVRMASLDEVLEMGGPDLGAAGVRLVA